MTELQQIKKNADSILREESSEFTVISHDHLEGDEWAVTVKSNTTDIVYTFKNDGFDSYEFKEVYD